MTCPTCGRKIANRKTTKAEPPVEARTDAEIFKAYKKTAPVEDARFFLRTQADTMSANLRVDLETLIEQGPKARAEFYRQLHAI